MKKFLSFFIISILFIISFSCENDLEYFDDTSSSNKNALVHISAEIQEETQRSVLPSITEDVLSGSTFTLYGKINETETEIGSWNSLTDLNAAEIVLEPGQWIFTLFAKNNGTVLKGIVSQKWIFLGTNNLKFRMVRDESEFSGTGSLEFDFSFPEDSGVKSAFAELVKYNLETLSENGVQCEEEKLELSENSVHYEKDEIPAGVYRIKLKFYADTDKNNLINVWRELVVISGGLKSYASHKTDTLNDVYTISYNLNGGSFDSGTVIPEVYTRNAGFTIPETVSKEGCLFAGWYESEDFSTKRINSVSTGSYGNKTFYARWVEFKIYVSESGIKTGVENPETATLETEEIFDGISSANALQNLSQAIKQINALVNAYGSTAENSSWEIIISGKVEGETQFSSVSASSLKISASSENENYSDDILLGLGFSGTATSFVVNIQNTVSCDITFYNLGIAYGLGGIKHEGTGTLTVQNCLLYKNTDSALYIAENCKVIVKDSTIGGTTGFENTASNGAGIFCKGEVLITGETKILGNKAASSGGGIYIDSTGSVSLSGEAYVSSNSAGLDGNGVYDANLMSFSEKAYVMPDNDVFIKSAKTITIDSDLEGEEPIATITPEDYVIGITILTGSNVSENYRKFSVTPKDDLTCGIDSDGKLYIRATKFYISASGSDTTGNGSLTNPFATISKAAQLFSEPTPAFSKTIREFENKIYVLSDYTFEHGSGVSGDYYFEIIGMKEGISDSNVTFTCNTPSDSAFYISGNQKIKFTNVNFTHSGSTINNYSTLLVAETAELYLENSSMQNISAETCSAIASEGKVFLKNVSIRNNTTLPTTGGIIFGPAVNLSKGTLYIQGEVVISGNSAKYSKDGNSYEKEMNVWIGDNSSGTPVFNPIIIEDSIVGSKIGISLYTYPTPAFTSGYSDYEDEEPSEYFYSDSILNVSLSAGEAILDSPSDFYVNESGSDLNGDGTEENPYKTLTAALEAIVSFPDSLKDYVIHINGLIPVANTYISTDSTTGITAASLTIKGNNSETDILDGSSSGRIMAIAAGIPVTISSLTLQNGSLQTSASVGDKNGGAIYYLPSSTSGSLTLNGVTIKNNSADGNGNAIYAGGTVILDGETNISDDIYLSNKNYPICVKSSSFRLGSGASQILLSAKMGNGSTEYSRGDTVLQGYDSYALISTQCESFALNSTIYSILYNSEKKCGNIAGTVSGGITVSLGGSISLVITVPKKSGDEASFVLKDSSSGSMVNVTPTSAKIEIRQNGTTLYSADAQSVTPAFLPAGEYELYCKAVCNGNSYDTTVSFTAIEPKVVMKTGSNIKSALSSSTIGMSSSSSSPTAFVPSSSAPPEDAATVLLSQDSSDIPCYAWKDGSTVYYYMEGYTDSEKLIPLNADCKDMFSGFSKLVTIDMSGFSSENVTNMDEMFNECSALTALDISTFDTSNVINMSDMFYGCKVLASLDLSGFNTGNVTSMQNMFYNCSALTSLDLSAFDTSKVTNMTSMFYNCSALISLDISGFDTGKVTNMSSMFNGCKTLTTLDVSRFTTSKVTYMTSMFNGCFALTSLDVSAFETGNVTSMQNMFYNCSALTSLDVSGFDTAKVTSMSSMFSGCSKVSSLDVSGFDTSNVTSMASMFSGCSALTSLDVRRFDTVKVTSMSSMFNGCSSLASLDVSGFDTSNVTSMVSMFASCSALTSLDVSAFETGNVETMASMFKGCSQLTEIDVTGFDSSNATNMGSMFSGCSSLTSIDVTDFDTAKVTSLASMFSGCSALTSLDVTGFDTAKVTYMYSMFEGCAALSEIDISSFDISALTQTYSMFRDCTALEKIYAAANADWNASANISSYNSSNMFSGCEKLKGDDGTVFDSGKTNKEYARIDGLGGSKGYWTAR